jgi:cytochrome c-type biogenesis protein CcmH
LSLWPILITLTVLVLALVLLPLVRPPGAPAARREYDLSVYRAQLGELERDQERGLLAPVEARAARLEIERRMLAADADGRAARAPGAAAGRRRLATALVVLLALPALSAVLYLRLGRPELPAVPFVERADRARTAAQAPGLPSVEKLVAELEQRVEAAPGDLEGWHRLARAYQLIDQPARAIQAYRRALALDEASAELQAGLAEAEIEAAGGIVTEAAGQALARALELEPANARARFYQGLALDQRGERRKALDLWTALIRDAPADAPYMPAVRERVTALAQDLGLDPADVVPEPAPLAGASAGRGPSDEQMQAARDMTPGQRTEMVQGMVESLAARLKDQPDDVEGWRMLARSYRVLGDAEKAAEAAGQVARRRPVDAAAQLDYAEALLALERDDAPLSAAAIAQLQRVAELDADNPEALYFLGRAAAEQGEPERARSYWQRLLARIPADAPQRAQLQKLIDQLGGRD